MPLATAYPSVTVMGWRRIRRCRPDAALVGRRLGADKRAPDDREAGEPPAGEPDPNRNVQKNHTLSALSLSASFGNGMSQILTAANALLQLEPPERCANAESSAGQEGWQSDRQFVRVNGDSDRTCAGPVRPPYGR
jgi:hypothetical protein